MEREGDRQGDLIVTRRRCRMHGFIETPSADDPLRLDRARKSNKLSNEEWTSKTDPEAKIAKLKYASGLQARARGLPSSSRQHCSRPIKATTTTKGTLTTAPGALAHFSAAPTNDEPSELTIRAPC
jgi:hypothetical protein